LLLAKHVGDAIARDAEQPRADLFDGPHQPSGLDQLVENLLQDILGVGRVRYALANEAAQAAALAHERLSDRTIMTGHGPVRIQFGVHTLCRRTRGPDIVQSQTFGDSSKPNSHCGRRAARELRRLDWAAWLPEK